VDAVNMHEAKTRLSQLVDAVESGRESEVVIARNGKPAARLVPIAQAPDTSKRIGIAKGKFTVPDDWDADDDLIAAMFEGRDPA
jgi:prevent-host-death family protein